MTRQYVIIVADGAGDSNCGEGGSPLERAHTPYMDYIAQQGISGRMTTLYRDLPRDSLVAHLGIFGWDPHLFYPHGRASAELLAAHNISLEQGDLVFRANIVRMDGCTLASYNADYIQSERAAVLVEQINQCFNATFPDFRLYHNSDFRTTLLIRDANVSPASIICTEPHESQGMAFDLAQLVRAGGPDAQALVARINHYLIQVGQLLAAESSYYLFPWGVSYAFSLPAFSAMHQFDGRSIIIGNMDFLHGMARAGGLEFCKRGTGRPETDYHGKGMALRHYLEAGYDFIACHINSPDEASHMYDVPLKIQCIERIDQLVVQQAVDYFSRYPERLGGIIILPDHYTNTQKPTEIVKRIDSHSLDPVPFILWNGTECDAVMCFSEAAALHGQYGAEPLSHLQTLSLLDITSAVHKEQQPHDRATERHLHHPNAHNASGRV